MEKLQVRIRIKKDQFVCTNYAITLLFIACFLIGKALSAQDIPSTARSERAIQTVRPSLEASLTGMGIEWGAPVFIRIFKDEKELEVWVQEADGGSFVLFTTYTICNYGVKGLGPKLAEGDGKAPEGFYFVTPGQLNPGSNFHLAFNIGYPNRFDRYHARTGSFIMVHGRCVSDGCFAMTDRKMNEIYALADASFYGGQPFFRVHIFPFRMGANRMARHRTSEWYSFWENLKEGYDFFEEKRLPPNVTVAGGRYAFD